MYIALRKIYTLCKFYIYIYICIYIYVYDACVINKVLIYMVDDNATASIVFSIRLFNNLMLNAQAIIISIYIYFIFK